MDKNKILNIIREEMYSLYAEPGEEESVFKERELSHEISRCLGEITDLIEIIDKKSKYPSDMDTVEVRRGQLQNWQNTLRKFLMAIGG